MYRRALIGLTAIIALCAACQRRAPRSAPPQPALSLVFTQIPLSGLRAMNPTFPQNMTPPDSSRIVRTTIGSGKLTVLSPGFAAASDPAVSYAGDSLLFAGKRNAGDPWNIWKMSLAGEDTPVQVTHDLGDCREPFFMALSSITPPSFTDRVRWIGFTSTAPGTFDEAGQAPATALYCQSLDSIGGRGIVTWRTTFDLDRDFSPTMLADGRVLFTSRRFDEYAPSEGIAGLLAANWAGTGLNPFFGVHTGAFVKSMASEFPNRRTVVFVESDGKTPLNGGSLARVHMARPLRTYERVSEGRGSFLTPYALPNGRMLVSYAPNGLNYGIYRYDPDKKRLGARLFDAPEWADIDPQAVLPRPEPRGRITIVVDSRSFGDIQCLNVYDTDNERMLRVPKGSVKRVRVVEGLPQRERAEPGSFTDEPPAVRVIGEAPVEPDGSFYLRLPADTPLSFQLLGEDGLSVMGMASWVWVRRGSRRGCIGCHENKELAPENRLTLALKRAHPDTLLTPPERRMMRDFLHDVAPIIARSCAGCHIKNHPTGLNLADGGPEAVYRRLLRRKTADGVPLVRRWYARESALAWRLFGHRLDGRAEPIKQMPLMGEISRGDVRTIVEWIDLGAAYENPRRGGGGP